MRRDNGLTMVRYDVLAHLDMAGRLGLTDLACAILLSQAGLSKLLDRMEAAGLVRRDPDPRDGRVFAAITSLGRSLVRSARQAARLAANRGDGVRWRDPPGPSRATPEGGRTAG